MNQKLKSIKLKPEMFEANEAWIIFYHAVEGGTYFLIDAASTYILAISVLTI